MKSFTGLLLVCVVCRHLFVVYIATSVEHLVKTSCSVYKNEKPKILGETQGVVTLILLSTEKSLVCKRHVFQILFKLCCLVHAADYDYPQLHIDMTRRPVHGEA